MACRRCEISTFIKDNGVDLFFVTETWLSSQGDEAKTVELAPSGFDVKSFPRQSGSRGGGIAAVIFFSSLVVTRPVFMALSKSLMSQLTGAVISLTGLLFDLTMTSIENLLLQTHLNQTTIALNPTSIFQSLSLLPYTGLLGTLLTLTAHHLLLNFPVFQSFHLLKMQTSSVTFCALY